jgi:hypothetical protein
MPWTDDIPMLSTARWPRKAPVEPVPLRYGRVSGRLLPYDAEGRVWVWAGHAVAGVTQVSRGPDQLTGWSWRNGLDPDGTPLAFVEFGTALPADANLTAEGVGALDARTGAAISLASDVLHDLIVRTAGGVWSSALRAFGRECRRYELIVAGSIEAPTSLQRACASVCASVGAVFAPSSLHIARVWPVPDPAGLPLAIVTRPSVQSASADIEDLATEIVARFGADGECAVDAPRAVKRYGRRVRSLDLPWCADLRTAIGVCQRLAAFVARPSWRVSAVLLPGDDLPFGRVRVGDLVRVRWHAAETDALGIVEQLAWSVTTGVHEVEVSVPVGPPPVLRLLRPRPADRPLPPPAGARFVVTDDYVQITDDDDIPITSG